MPDDLVNSLPIVEDKISSSKYFEIVDKLREFLASNQSTFKNFVELSFEQCDIFCFYQYTQS